ncbi:MAG: hypothetical protein IT529_05335 [Burkholderiales bacterium]|nr:hypothetical protein [Burkholderiales bacterium]
MRTNYVLIDFENVHVTSLALLGDACFRVHLFLGPNHTRVPSELVLAMHELRERANYVRLRSSGRNALDFHIAYYLGALAAADPGGFFHVISRDAGFDPLIQHLKEKGVFSARSDSIEAMPCFQAQARRAAPGSEDEANGSLAKLVKLVLDDLVKRKAAKPRRVATLRSTVLARMGKDSAGSLDAVLNALVREGYVTVDGGKISYDLPG